jgi:hypothetical protein
MLGSLSCASSRVTVWKLPGVREERQLGGSRTLSTQAPRCGHGPYLATAYPMGGSSCLHCHIERMNKVVTPHLWYRTLVS